MSTLLDYTFFRNAILGIIILSIAAAVIGTYIMTRRMVFISGGITHACFGGLGLGYYLGVSPVAMAAAFAVVSSLGVEWMSTRFRVREDSAIAVMWALGMAIGVLFVFLTPGYVPELNSFLFGNILTISTTDLWTFGLFTLMLLAFLATFYHKIVACAFDRDFARVSGLPVRFITYSMTIFVAVCIVLTIRLVGIMLLMSMLTMPQMIAETYCRRFGPMMTVSVIVAVACSLAGLLLAAVIDVPCSAVIVILMVIVYFTARLTRVATMRRDMQ
ncbi:MAG: metal ABC transporter permease [Pseudoflavonifractor sp.]|nr:metal ABC transporter permease [Pseudoflavonifractor sp.]